MPETPPGRPRLATHDPRRTQRSGGPGRTLGGDSAIQRGWLNPDHQLFGQVTSRTRHPDSTTAPPSRLTNTEEPPSENAGKRLMNVHRGQVAVVGEGHRCRLSLDRIVHSAVGLDRHRVLRQVPLRGPAGPASPRCPSDGAPAACRGGSAWRPRAWRCADRDHGQPVDRHADPLRREAGQDLRDLPTGGRGGRQRTRCRPGGRRRHHRWCRPRRGAGTQEGWRSDRCCRLRYRSSPPVSIRSETPASRCGRCSRARTWTVRGRRYLDRRRTGCGHRSPSRRCHTSRSTSVYGHAPAGERGSRTAELPTHVASRSASASNRSPNGWIPIFRL